MRSRLVPSGRLLPLIIATGLLMQNLDSTVLSTALPTIAQEFGANPIHLKLALTSYLLSLAIFIPASGWMADRYGARTVFRAAIIVFCAGSIACGLSQNLPELVLARIAQGMGGAMMTPVGRLIILKTTPKRELVDAMAFLTIPALLGPLMGPPLGGFITTYFSWRWIFWINVPIAVVGVILTSRFVPNVREDERRPFDTLGFLLVGPGLAALLSGATLAGIGLVSTRTTIALALAGAALIVAYVFHALRNSAPLIELRLLSFPSFRTATGGGFLFRVAAGATPFLLPLMFQLGFGFTAFQSGLLSLATGLGALTMKPVASRILRRWGFRHVMIVNAALSSAFLAVPALFTPGTAVWAMAAVLLVGGFVRSLQFTSINVSALSDVPDALMGRVTSFTSVLQELSGSVGVSVAALGLEAAQRYYGLETIGMAMFPPVFLMLGGIGALSVLVFLALPRDVGREMLAPVEPNPPTPAPAPAE